MKLPIVYLLSEESFIFNHHLNEEENIDEYSRVDVSNLFLST